MIKHDRTKLKAGRVAFLNSSKWHITTPITCYAPVLWSSTSCLHTIFVRGFPLPSEFQQSLDHRSTAEGHFPLPPFYVVIHFFAHVTQNSDSNKVVIIFPKELQLAQASMEIVVRSGVGILI